MEEIIIEILGELAEEVIGVFLDKAAEKSKNKRKRKAKEKERDNSEDDYFKKLSGI